MGLQEQIKPEHEIIATHLGEQAEGFLREVDAGRYGSDMDNAVTRLAYAIRESILDFSEDEGGRRIITDVDKFQGDMAGMKETVLKQYPTALMPTIEKMFAKVELRPEAPIETDMMDKAA